MKKVRKARYYCIEGLDGAGKSTHCKKLVEHLRNRGFKVLLTKEPGTIHAPLTMELRGIMLDVKHEQQMTPAAREFISQAIRSIHIDKVIVPALQEYDYIIQDRGVLSGLCYGHVCGNTHLFLSQLAAEACRGVNCHWHDLYDKVIYMRVDPATGLLSAQNTKQEFAAGDVIEAKGKEFMYKVRKDMDEMVHAFPHCTIEMDGKTIDENFNEILRNIDLGV